MQTAEHLEISQHADSGALMVRVGSRMDLQALLRMRQAVVSVLNGDERPVILDLSSVVELAMSAEDLHTYARLEPATRTLRIVVAPDPVIYGSARIVELLRDEEGQNLQVVAGLHEAYSMLGLGSPHFSPLELAPS